MKPSEEIRGIFEEIKLLKHLRGLGIEAYDKPMYMDLEIKYENIEKLFGHESSLLKAIIFVLDKKQKRV